MGERKAVNKYYPPDWDPSKGGLDKYHGQHPLRERASKLHLGILVIRFEMPFNIWCGGCNNHIGMGVRYNAEKKKIGMYYTTPIWQFRMKCHLCDNYIEMHTDPKNFDYIVASGGRRKEERYEQQDAECPSAHEPEERKRLGTDPMFKLQYQKQDEEVVEEAEPIIDKLHERQGVWKDDYQINRDLRKRHREDTKGDKTANSFLKNKMGLDVKMLPTNKQDKITSSLVRFTTQRDGVKLDKKSAIGSIFSNDKTRVLASLKQAGVKSSRDTTSIPRDTSSNSVKGLVRVGNKRKRSNESSSSSSSSTSSSHAPALNSLSQSASTLNQPSQSTSMSISLSASTKVSNSSTDDAINMSRSHSCFITTRTPESKQQSTESEADTSTNSKMYEEHTTQINSIETNFLNKSSGHGDQNNESVCLLNHSLVSGYSSTDSD